MSCKVTFSTHCSTLRLRWLSIIIQCSDDWSDFFCSQYMSTAKVVLPNLDNQRLLSVSSPSILLLHVLGLVVWENKFPALMSLLPKCCYWNGSVCFALWCHLPHSQLGIIESNNDSQSWEQTFSCVLPSIEWSCFAENCEQFYFAGIPFTCHILPYSYDVSVSANYEWGFQLNMKQGGGVLCIANPNQGILMK